jgi:hypothetical protein
MTPIEQLLHAIKTQGAQEQSMRLYDILIPEQCAMISMNGKMYHVTIEECHEAVQGRFKP